MSSFADLEPALAELESFPAPWWVCGGWAIDLFLGRITREHEDIEVAVYRVDQQRLREHYADWGSFKSFNGWLPWKGEAIELPLHQLLFRPPGSGPPPDPWEPEPEERQFFLEDVEDGVWRCRRDERITRPFGEVVERSENGTPFVVPEIQLLFKAKHHLDKDEQDFRATLPLLGPERRTWLRDALELVHPGDPWLGALG